MELPAGCHEDVPELAGLLPQGTVLGTVERWLGDRSTHAYQLALRVQAADAFSLLKNAATKRSGTRPRRMPDQRKLVFDVGGWSYIAFGSDGEESLLLQLHQSCDEATCRRGTQRAVQGMDWVKPFLAWTVLNVACVRLNDGREGGTLDLAVDDADHQAKLMKAMHPQLEVWTMMGMLRVQRVPFDLAM